MFQLQCNRGKLFYLYAYIQRMQFFFELINVAKCSDHIVRQDANIWQKPINKLAMPA